jgi:2'-5' RNA ligase
MAGAERRSSIGPALPAHARLFLALWPTPAVRARLAAWRDAWRFAPGAAPTPDDRLHLTLHFIGAVARERVAEIGAGLDLRAAPFTLGFGRCEVWPGGIAVLRPDAVPPSLRTLHADLRDRLLALRLHVEDRPFRAHVTCARKAVGALAPPIRPGALRWPVRGHALVESRPGHGGGYVVLRRYAAAGP